MRKLRVRLALVLVIMLAHEWLASRGVLVWNQGASLGIYIPGLVLVALVTVVWWWRFRGLGVDLVLGGGVVNIIDRCRFGAVRDYWRLGESLSNNVADWAIWLGVIVIVVDILRNG